MRLVPALLVLVALVLPACGDADDPVLPSGESGTGDGPLLDTPKATFEHFKKVSLARDWTGLWELQSPRERAECVAKWRRMRTDASKRERLERIAGGSGVTRKELETMPLKEVFTRRNAYQLQGPGAAIYELVKMAEYVGFTPGEKNANEGMLSFRLGEGETQVPVRKEGSRWYMFMTLTALLEG